MKALAKQSAQDLMNRLGQDQRPFIFIISYNADENYIIPLDSIDPLKIKYKVGEWGDQETYEGISKVESFEISPLTSNDYEKAFHQVKEEIQAGNTYLLNLTFPTRIQTNLSLEDIYKFAKAPYKLLLCNRFVVFSPEIFIRIQNGEISAFPMKGTIDAAIPNADKKILDDRKETAEHYTITDLIRNDLSMVSKNVRVKRFRYIDRIETNKKTLLQVSSEICGRLSDDYHSRLGDILFTLLPAGSVTGAPKKKTLEIIDVVEKYNRGFYTGVFGIFDGNNLESAVMIRFIEQDSEGHLMYKSGGGITAYSNASDEYQELIDKVYVPLG